MTSKEIEQNLLQLTKNIMPEGFIFDFLLAFGFPKASISRLRNGDFNRSKVAGEILYKGKLFFKESQSGEMLFEIENLAKNEVILKQNPRFIFLTDFKNVVAKDLKTKASKEFPIEELAQFKDFFIPLTGAEIYKSSNDNKVDREASYALARFYDIIIQDNPGLYEENSHDLNILLSRLLFCFFAEDTAIFPKEGIFTDAIANYTAENGSDLDDFLKELFAKLNSRKTNFSNSVNAFPYVNGGLFKDEIVLPKFSKKAREILLDSGNLNWDEINPDIFGSMIQAVADPEERSDLGMHYTSVPNILKLIKPLFLDELYEEFENNRNQPKKLEKLLTRLSTIKFFDPACGSGNFLIITYKELRLLEIKIIQQLIDLENEDEAQTKKSGGKQAKIYYPQIQLSQFYGIEIKDFAHEMAILSLWLAEHQMNKIFVEQLEGFGQTDPILPLKESGKITHANAATMDWELACPKNEGDEIYIIGNPPYLGSRYQKDEHRNDIEIVLKGFGSYKKLDYITIWLYKGTKYIQGINAQLAFVSTNSVCQGEQVSLLWPKILKENIEIGFAHQSFKWINNAKGNAGVTVIIVGLRNVSTRQKFLFNNNIRKEAKNINAYLTDSSNVFINSRTNPFIKIPKVQSGNRALDNGNFLLNATEKKDLLLKYPEISKIIKPIIGAAEFLQGKEKFCLWIEEENINYASGIPEIKLRLENVREFRNARDLNDRKNYFQFLTMNLAQNTLFFIPTVSSERREYIPIGVFDNCTVIIDPNFAIYDAQ